MTNSGLYKLLQERRKLDLKIERLVAAEYGGNLRFSAKKFVGDLGELLFSINVPLFSSLEQSVNSNDEFDFLGVLKSEYLETFSLKSPEVRIEVKTRHAQKRDNHLFGLHPNKFDLLAFVALGEDFDCRHIGIIRSSDVVPDDRGRITYASYYDTGKVKWQLNPWVKL